MILISIHTYPVFLEKPLVKTTFCQANPNIEIGRIEYEYNNDNNDNLISETCFNNNGIQYQKFFQYNSAHQLLKETYKTSSLEHTKDYIYNTLGILMNVKHKFIYYDANGKIVKETEQDALREYDENNQLIKEWSYWGGLQTYKYKDGQMIEKIEYTSDGQKHHLTYYKYFLNVLLEEKKETSSGSLIYLKKYIYDSQNRLVQVKDRGNIIEENKYIDNKLIEQRIYYFGIDPGYYSCSGNYIYKFEYE